MIDRNSWRLRVDITGSDDVFRIEVYEEFQARRLAAETATSGFWDEATGRWFPPARIALIRVERIPGEVSL